MTTTAEQSVPVTHITKTKKSVPAKSKSSFTFEDVENQLNNIDAMFRQLIPHHWMPTHPWSPSSWKRFSPFDLKSVDELFNKSLLDPDLWGMSALERFSPFEMNMPKVDVIDRDQEMLIRADMPGVRKEDLDVSVAEGSLSLKGNTSEEKEEDLGDYHKKETMQGSFSRTISLPKDVDIDKIKADYKNGVLEVLIPKKEEAKRRPVKVA